MDLPSELKPTGHSPEAIRRWIAAVCRRLNTTPTELARRADLAPSTVNRFLSGNSKNNNVSASTISKLTEATANIYYDFLQTASAEDGTFIEKVEVEANWAGKPVTSFDKTIIQVPVIGFVSSNTWNSQTELPREERYNVSIPISNIYANLPIIGLEVRGGTSNSKFPNTSIIICVPYYALDRDPLHEEFVVVNRKNRFDNIESQVRQYMKSDYGEDWLIALPDERPFQPPISVDGIYDDTMIVSLLVITSIQPERSHFRRPQEFDPRNRA